MCVTDTDATSYVGQSVTAVLCSAEEEKKHKSKLCHAFFAPFVISVDGSLAIGHEALMLVQHLADGLSGGCMGWWLWSCACMDAWVKVHLAFAIIRATNLCFRGSRVRWQNGTSIDDRMELASLMLH